MRGNAELHEVAKALDAERASLREDISRLSAQSLSLDCVKDNPITFKHLTGLSNYERFQALVRYSEGKVRRLKWWRGTVTVRKACNAGGAQRRSFNGERKLSIEQQFYYVLVRLRSSPSVMEMALRCGIPRLMFSRMFTT